MEVLIGIILALYIVQTLALAALAFKYVNYCLRNWNNPSHKLFDNIKHVLEENPRISMLYLLSLSFFYLAIFVQYLLF